MNRSHDGEAEAPSIHPRPPRRCGGRGGIDPRRRRVRRRRLRGLERRRRVDRPRRLLDPPAGCTRRASSPRSQDTSDGEGVEFSNSFGASGDQSRAVESGLPADFVDLPLEPDMTALVEAGIVAEDWTTTGTRPTSRTPSSCSRCARAIPRASRTGTTSSPGTSRSSRPNPFTSGGAKWNIMAAYGAQLDKGASEQEALDYVGSSREHLGPGRQRAATRCRRSRAARATSCSRTRTRRSRPRRPARTSST